MAKWHYKKDTYDTLAEDIFQGFGPFEPKQLVQGMLSLGKRLASPGPQPW